MYEEAQQMEKAVILVMLRPPAPCEEASNLETCTITAPDVITAFAVPNPNCSSQSESVFSGLAAQLVAQLSESPNLLRIG